MSFELLSYLGQVRRLREVAREAIKGYGIKVQKMDFINHGENATFCVHAANGQRYLLRILRGGYHTDKAVDAELRWLRYLSTKGFSVPTPMPSKNGKLSLVVATEGVPNGRRACLFEWLDGSFINKSISVKHMYEIGVLLAKLQKSVPRGIAKHRRYWTSDGLVGHNPKFGPIDNLLGVSPKNQQIINRARMVVHAKLRRYENRTNKMGMIHADLHFKNILLSSGRIAAIDFDDSGYGFHVYDLAVTLQSARHELGPKRKHEFPKLQEALIAGYSQNAAWTNDDENMIQHLISARNLAVLGWLNSRSDNPRLRTHLKKSARNVAKCMHELYR
jgi:Ser/Thr protein kinase RdoA (MazF antagonist)